MAEFSNQTQQNIVPDLTEAKLFCRTGEDFQNELLTTQTSTSGSTSLAGAASAASTAPSRWRPSGARRRRSRWPSLRRAGRMRRSQRTRRVRRRRVSNRAWSRRLRGVDSIEFIFAPKSAPKIAPKIALRVLSGKSSLNWTKSTKRCPQN